MVTLQQLQYFKKLAEIGHLTRTAEQLHITQATLSNTIFNLEKQLGVKLFSREGRALKLNSIGQRYLGYVTQTLGALENGQAFIDDTCHSNSRKVLLATHNSMAWKTLIFGFQEHYPEHSIQQANYPPNLLRPLLLNMEVDFALGNTMHFSLDGLAYRVLTEEQLCLVVPRSHPLAGRESVSLREIADESFIFCPSPASSLRKFCEEQFEKAGLHCNVAMECDYALRAPLVEAGFGVALTTCDPRSSRRAPNAVIPISDDVPRISSAIIWNPDRYLSQAAQDFLRFTLSLHHMPFDWPQAE